MPVIFTVADIKFRGICLANMSVRMVSLTPSQRQHAKNLSLRASVRGGVHLFANRVASSRGATEPFQRTYFAPTPSPHSDPMFDLISPDSDLKSPFLGPNQV